MRIKYFTRVLFIMIAIILVVVAILGTIQTLNYYSSIRTLKQDSAKDVLSLVDAQIHHFIEHPEMEIRDYLMRIFDEETQKLLVNASDDLSPLVNYVYRVEVINQEGLVVAGSPLEKERVGFDLKRQDIYRSLCNMKSETLLGHVVIDQMTGDTCLFLSIKKGDYYVVGYFSLAIFQDALKDLRTEGSVITVLDNEGKYLVHPRADLVNQRQVNPHFKEIASKKLRPGDRVEYYHDDYFLYSKYLEELDYFVLYYSEIGDVYVPIRNGAIFSLLMFVLLAGTSLLAIHKISRQANITMDNVMSLTEELLDDHKIENTIEFENDALMKLQDNLVQLSVHMKQEIADTEATNEKLEISRYQSLSRLANLVESLDGFTEDHCNNVTKYSLLLGSYCHLSDDEMLQLKYGAMLHDIGKINLPMELIQHQSIYTDIERTAMQEHTVLGFEILSGIPMFEKTREIILYHHERYDGKGYPFGKRDEEIPLLARIVAIADAYDAMTSQRPYRKKTMLNAEAINELLRCKNKHFDGRLVDTFIKAMNTIGNHEEEEK